MFLSIDFAVIGSFSLSCRLRMLTRSWQWKSCWDDVALSTAVDEGVEEKLGVANESSDAVINVKKLCCIMSAI